MDREEALDVLRELLREIAGVAGENVAEDKSFADDLDVDSLSMVELVTAAEERFDVRIPDEVFAELKTVKDVLDHLERLATVA